MLKEDSCAALIENENADAGNLQAVIQCSQPAASQCSACGHWFCDQHFYHQIGLCAHCYKASFAHADDTLPQVRKEDLMLDRDRLFGYVDAAITCLETITGGVPTPRQIQALLEVAGIHEELARITDALTSVYEVRRKVEEEEMND